MFKQILLTIFAMSLIPAALAAGVSGGNVSQIPFDRDLATQLKSLNTTGYDYVAFEHRQVFTNINFCCDPGYGGCRLGSNRHWQSHGYPDNYTTAMTFVMELGSGGVRDIQIYSANCPLDADGFKVAWLNDVPVEETIQFLSDQLLNHSANANLDKAMVALAVIDHPDASNILYDMARPGNNRNLREKAIFWVANLRGVPGFEFLKALMVEEDDPEIREKIVFGYYINKSEEAIAALRQIADSDSSRKVRKQAMFWLVQTGAPGIEEEVVARAIQAKTLDERKEATFHLSLLKNERGIPKLIELAKFSDERAVRKQALFWLSQKAGKLAVETLDEVANSDLDPEVAKSAVFGISQLPAETATPMLVKLAKSHPSRTVRKQAIFWLGQSGDERAVEVFEELLNQ